MWTLAKCPTVSESLFGQEWPRVLNFCSLGHRKGRALSILRAISNTGVTTAVRGGDDTPIVWLPRQLTQTMGASGELRPRPPGSPENLFGSACMAASKQSCRMLMMNGGPSVRTRPMGNHAKVIQCCGLVCTWDVLRAGARIRSRTTAIEVPKKKSFTRELVRKKRSEGQGKSKKSEKKQKR